MLGKFQDSGERMLFTPDMTPILGVLDTAGLAEAMKDPDTDTTKRSWQAYRAGLRTGDRVVSVDSVPVTRWSEFQAIIRTHPNQTLNILVERKGKEIPFDVNTKSIARIGVIAYTDT